MGRERSSGCCVILRSRFIDATHNFLPSLCFMPDGGTYQRHLYLIVSIHPSLWISSRFPIITTPSLCVRPLLLSPLSYVHITFLPLTPFVVYIFYPTFSFSFVYIPPLTVDLS